MSEVLAGYLRVSKHRIAIVSMLATLLLLPVGIASASGPNGAIRGFITDSVSSNAVAGALVRISASDIPWLFEVTTTSGGFYAVSLPNHAYTVAVTEQGHMSNTTSVTVGSSLTIWNNMTLSPAAARSMHVQGYVKDSVSSSPVTVGRIVAGPPWYVSGSSYVNSSAMDASGFYSMYIVPGTYTLATSGIFGYHSVSVYPFYANTGPIRWYNFSLNPNPFVAWINGTVRDGYTYAPIAGANVTAMVDGLTFTPATSNATGFYSVLAPSGDVQLGADAAGHAPNSAYVYVTGSGSYSTDLYLTPLSTGIRGFVRDGLTGAAISGVLVSTNPIFSGGYVDEAKSSGTGYYAINLPADDYDLTAGVTGYTSWWSWAFLSSGTIVWANVTLWPIISTIKGYLIDGATGRPVTGLTVYASDSRSAYYASAVADASSFYSLALPPSPAITLHVWGASPYAGAVAYLDTRPYATTWANLTLARLTAQVRATVTDALTGLPISGASVTASWYYGTNWALTNASGVGTVSVPVGIGLTVYAWASGYFAWYGTIPAVSDAYTLSIELDPALPSNVTVEGYVTDAGTGSGVFFGYVQATGYNGSTPVSFTDGTGFYQLAIVAQPQTIHATSNGYAAGVASVSPTSAGTIWLNFSLSRDTTAPRILGFTANPSSNLQPSNPATLQGTVNETSFAHASVSALMLQSSAGNVGTFLDLGPLDPSTVSTVQTAPGNVTVSSSWDTRTPVARLSDSSNLEWWPAATTYGPFLVAVSGYWTNAMLASPTYGTAMFDSRSGSLLYVVTAYGYIDPRDQPASTFTPYEFEYGIDLTTAAILGTSIVRGPAFVVGSLRLTVTNPVPGGTYAALLEAWDAAGNYASAATILQVATDTTPPVANAGADQAVNQDATVTFDGSGSSDNVGVANYTWTFTDGSPRVLYGETAIHVFATPGVFVVTLTVRDAAGNAASDTMTVTVADTQAPTLSITSPSEGANLSGSFGILVTASDNVGVVRVEFLVDGAPVGNATSAPFALTLNSRALPNGHHTIEAIAFDAAGNSASTSHQVVVYNQPGGGSGPSFLGLDGTTTLALVFALVAVAILIAWVLARRKRPRAPYAQPPAPAVPLGPPMQPAESVPPEPATSGEPDFESL